MKKTRKVLLTILSVLTIAAVSLGAASCFSNKENSSSTGSSMTDSSTEDSSTEDSSTEDSSTEDSSTGDSSSEDSSTEDSSSEDSSMEDSSSEITEPTGTEGVLYQISSDGTYAEVTGYKGTATEVRIADTYEGLPVKTICEEAFCQKTTITSVEIPDSVTSIGYMAFTFCDSLTSVYITDIAAWCNISFGDYSANPLYSGKNLYLNNELVTELVISDSVTEIRPHAFRGCSFTSVVIGGSVTSIGCYAFAECKSLTGIEVSADNAAYQSIDGNLYTKDGTTLLQYAIGKTVTSFTIPAGVTSIGDGAFCDCSLTGVEIGGSVTSIGNSAFSGCISLTSVEIPDSVTSIDDRAFSDCYSLTSVVIGGSVTSIGDYAFSSCGRLKSVEIPDSVTSIGDWAFWFCYSLTSVVIGGSVTSIGEGAFYQCRSLTSVYYKGTASEWSAISNSSLKNAMKCYYSETEPTEEGNYWHYVDGEVTVW